MISLRSGAMAAAAVMVLVGSIAASAGTATTDVNITVNGQGPFNLANSKPPYDGTKPFIEERSSVKDTYRFVIPRKNGLDKLAWATSDECPGYPPPKERAFSGVVIANKSGTIILRAG
jgi:hypothetical protein